MARLIPFEPQHAVDIELREWDALSLCACGQDEPAQRLLMGRAAAAGGPAFTLLAPGGIVACAGVLLVGRGTGVPWAFTSPLVERMPLAFHRACSRILHTIEQDFGLHRLQASVLEQHRVGARWLERMGFEREGLLRRLGGDENYYLYARVAQ